MKRIIHLEATPEPNAYHEDTATGNAYFAVHTALEIARDSSGDETEAAARFEYEKYLDLLPKRQILLLKIKADLSGVESVTQCGTSDTSAGEIPKLMDWLDGRKAGLEEVHKRLNNVQSVDLDFYLVEQAAGPEPDVAIEASRTTARDLLRSSLNWVAPIPQRFRLLALVNVPEQVWDALHVFVPYPENGGAAPSETEFTVAELKDSNGVRQGFNVSYNFLGLGAVTCESPLIVEYANSALSKNPVFDDDGSIVFNPEADKLFRLVSAIEEESASRLWPFVALSEFDWSKEESSAGVDPDLVDPKFNSELKWLVKNCLLTLLDPLSLALREPKGNPMFLERLVSLMSQSVGLAISQSGAVHPLPDAELIAPAINGFYSDFFANQLWNSSYVWSLFADAMDAGPEENIPELPELTKLMKKNELAEQLQFATYVAELAEMAVKVEDEVGIESLILAMLKQILGTNAERLSIKLDGTGRFNNAVLQGFQAFKTFVREEWNGSEVVRRDVGRLFSQALINKSQPLNVDHIKVLLSEADWFNARAVPPAVSNDALKTLREALSKFEAPDQPLDAGFTAKLAAYLTTVYVNSVDAMVVDKTASDTFRPDSAPQPLPIQIADKLDGETIDEINASFTGFGIVVQAKGTVLTGAFEEAAHASLVDLSASPVDKSDVYSQSSVLPALPAINDGSTELFINYRGLPINSTSQVDTSQGGPILDEVQRAERDAAMPPYAVKDAELPEPTQIDDLRAPAPLAYGFEYGARAFWVANSGALPLFVRDDSDPLKPSNPEFLSGGNIAYLRRTAVSEITILEANIKTRIGAIPKGVFPLAEDYPRLSISRPGDNSGVLALFRRPDGGGRSWSEDGEKIEELVLYDYSASDGTGLVVDAIVNVTAVASNLPTSVEGNRLLIDLSSVTEDEFWLEFTIDSSGTISFADPSNEDHETSRVDDAPLLLIAPDSANNWNAEYTSAMKGSITVPGVSFADFDCWASNPVLMKRLSGFNDAAKDEVLLDRLREARAQFDFFDETYANLTNQLPDPGVERMLITLEVCDLMTHGNVPGAKHEVIEIEPYKIDGALLAADKDRYEDLKGLVDRVIEGANFEFQIACADFDLVKTANGISISVPEGMVATLRIEPLVSVDFFGGPHRAFDQEVANHLATRTHVEGGSNWHVFRGTSLKIEGMSLLSAESSPPDDSLYLHPDSQSSLYPAIDGTVRAYQLTLDPSKDVISNWRQFGEADVITQRWRPSGRPIYRWIDPTDFHPQIDGQRVERPAVEIKETVGNRSTSKSSIENFENDAFFDRMPDDAERSRVRLVPSPEPTILGRFKWASASATYYRHRLALRSRYAPAMRNAEREVASSKGNAWTCRAAILADRGSANVTRPQVRSFLPMLQPVDRTQATGAPPPLICVLAEKPFGQYGLADRIVGGIETVHNYRIVTVAGEKRIRLVDLRKEIGPDPRLSYYGVDNQASKQMMLRSEGPVGLHFDASTTANPAFSNSQYLLHIDAASVDKELEECFSGVSLQRVTEPGWLWSGPGTVGSPPSADSNTWWLQIKAQTLEGEDPDLSEEFLKMRHGDNDLVVVSRAGNEISVEVAIEALYPSSGPGFANLCTVNIRRQNLFWLHRKLNDSLYSLSILARPVKPSTSDQEIKNVDDGVIDQLQLVASIEYHASGKIDFLGTDGNVVTPKLRHVAASDTTFVEWVRTNRNLSEFEVRDKRLPLSKISARLNKTAGKGRLELYKTDDLERKKLRLRSPVSSQNYPLHVRRHLALFLRQVSTDLGREIGLYNQAILLGANGGDLDIELSASTADYTVAVAEFETRAEVLLNSDSGTAGAESYKQAKFDLISTRPEQGLPGAEISPDGLRQLRFNIRVPHLGFGDHDVKYTMSVETVGEPIDGGSSNLEMVGKAPPGADELTLLITLKDNDNLTWQMIFDSEDESTPQAINEATLSDIKQAKTLILEMGRVDNNEDLWTDISLLHSSKSYVADDHASAVDFDWFFNAARTEDNIAEAVSPFRLNRLAEAQARLIGLSDPIKVDMS